MNWKTVDQIRQWIDHRVFYHVAQETDTYVLWTMLEGMYQSKTARNKALVMRKLVNLKLKNDVSVAEHTSEFKNLVNHLATVKMPLDDEIFSQQLCTRGEATMSIVTDAMYNEETMRKDIGALLQPPKGFCKSFFPSKDLKKLLDLPVSRQRAPLLLNFIPTYKSVLPDIPKNKKSKSSSSATTPPATSSYGPDQGSTSNLAEQPLTLAPQLIPPSQRQRRHRVAVVKMGHKKAVADDLLANIPDAIITQPSQPQPKPKPKRLKKAQSKAMSEKTPTTAEKRSAEAKPSPSTRSKRPRSESATTLGTIKSDAPWAPKITIKDKPVRAGDSADDIEVGVALSTALLLPQDLNRNAEMSEYENFVLSLQHSVQAIRHCHSFALQAFNIKKELTNKTKEAANSQRARNKAEGKLKALIDQAEVAKKAQDEAEEKTDVAEAIAKVLAAEKKEAEAKMVETQKELQDALATKKAEIKVADKKAYAEGVADVKEDYMKQVKQEALVRKKKDATRATSLALNEQVVDLSQDEEGEVSKDATPEKTTSDVPIAEKSIDQTLQEIDAELAAEKAVEENSQMSSEPHTQPANDAE
ncbi:dynactin subunit 1-like [Camellia sinensis]|uniref:dynactin subunit 1-like n=1 Tax=Camellia sinensis TaxID=4442 RepID=UPI001036B9D0|nr:dynactin subunit 1-like [Camellia sinensis]